MGFIGTFWYVCSKRPLWFAPLLQVCDRMAKEIREVPDGPNFSARERLALIGHVNKLSASVGGAERIHQTVVPLNYARHTLRALTLWLFSFPLAVVKDLHLMTGPTLFLVSWLLFGVYEIGCVWKLQVMCGLSEWFCFSNRYFDPFVCRYAIEDPFQGSLRLSILCDTIRRDVMGSKLRTSAFELDDDLAETEEEDDDEREGEDDTYHPGLKNPMVNSRPNAVGNKPPISLPRFLKQAQSPDAYQ